MTVKETDASWNNVNSVKINADVIHDRYKEKKRYRVNNSPQGVRKTT